VNALAVALLLILPAADPARPFTVPSDAYPEYGPGLKQEDVEGGWISLFDGQTTFGWNAARVEQGRLCGGTATSRFANGILKAEVVAGGDLTTASGPQRLAPGERVVTKKAGEVLLSSGLKLKSLAYRPLGLESIFSGKDLAGWKPIPHPNLPADKQTQWKAAEGVLQATGGPGAIELLDREYDDFVLQLEVRTAQLTNGGIFFRALPGQFMNGYEAQIFNACYDNDPAQPATYSTGALDDHQLARRLVSRDEKWFAYTIIAVGPHIATWVNGCQLTDWTDARAPHENPRRGLRVEPGVIQLQAHDPDTQIEFRNIRIVELK